MQHVFIYTVRPDREDKWKIVVAQQSVWGRQAGGGVRHVIQIMNNDTSVCLIVCCTRIERKKRHKWQ
jgi:hypothetical protein